MEVSTWGPGLELHEIRTCWVSSKAKIEERNFRLLAIPLELHRPVLDLGRIWDMDGSN